MDRRIDGWHQADWPPAREEIALSYRLRVLKGIVLVLQEKFSTRLALADSLLAWGARAIFHSSDKFPLDILWDRQGHKFDRDTQKEAYQQFADFMNRSVLPKLQELAHYFDPSDHDTFVWHFDWPHDPNMIVGAFHRHLLELHRSGVFGDDLINHPVALAFVSKLVSLCRMTTEREMAALRAIDLIEKGESVEYEVVPL